MTTGGENRASRPKPIRASVFSSKESGVPGESSFLPGRIETLLGQSPRGTSQSSDGKEKFEEVGNSFQHCGKQQPTWFPKQMMQIQTTMWRWMREGEKSTLNESTPL